MIRHPLDPAAEAQLPFMVNEGRPRIGLRKIPETEWLHRDDQHAAEVELKRQIQLTAPEASARWTDDAEPACVELLNLVSGTSASDRLDHPIAMAGSQIQEDLCVLDGDTLGFIAGSVSFPFGWSLAAMLGHDLAGIHRRVPHYRPMAVPAEKVVRGLGDDVRARMNWFLIGHGELREHPDEPKPAMTGPHLRFERQTLRRLPISRAVVFTIRTYVAPIETLASRSTACAGLLAALDARTGAQADYHAVPAEIDRRARTWLTDQIDRA